MIFENKKIFLELYMKKKTHPPYQEVLFIDSSNGYKFVCGSTLQPKEKEEFEGKEYPVYRLSVSSSSHPFFTKSKQFIDTEGRVDKFTKRYQMQAKQAKQALEKQEEQKQKKPVKKKKAAKKK
jgi:large subunit ribosomal protein L31